MVRKRGDILKYREVNRPKTLVKGHTLGECSKRILGTADTGKAIALVVTWEMARNIRSNIYYVAKRRGLKAHGSYSKRRGILTLWCERLLPSAPREED